MVDPFKCRAWRYWFCHITTRRAVIVMLANDFLFLGAKSFPEVLKPPRNQHMFTRAFFPWPKNLSTEREDTSPLRSILDAGQFLLWPMDELAAFFSRGISNLSYSEDTRIWHGSNHAWWPLCWQRGLKIEYRTFQPFLPGRVFAPMLAATLSCFQLSCKVSTQIRSQWKKYIGGTHHCCLDWGKIWLLPWCRLQDFIWQVGGCSCYKVAWNEDNMTGTGNSCYCEQVSQPVSQSVSHQTRDFCFSCQPVWQSICPSIYVFEVQFLGRTLRWNT